MLLYFESVSNFALLFGPIFFAKTFENGVPAIVGFGKINSIKKSLKRSLDEKSCLL